MIGAMRKRPDHFEDFEATELFCPTCRRATPVRKKLLIILPDGNKYEYLCSVCAGSVGEKMDDDRSGFSILRP